MESPRCSSPGEGGTITPSCVRIVARARAYADAAKCVRRASGATAPSIGGKGEGAPYLSPVLPNHLV